MYILVFFSLMIFRIVMMYIYIYTKTKEKGQYRCTMIDSVFFMRIYIYIV
jgi:hypothetical protein